MLVFSFQYWYRSAVKSRTQQPYNKLEILTVDFFWSIKGDDLNSSETQKYVHQKFLEQLNICLFVCFFQTLSEWNNCKFTFGNGNLLQELLGSLWKSEKKPNRTFGRSIPDSEVLLGYGSIQRCFLCCITRTRLLIEKKYGKLRKIGIGFQFF